MLNVTFLLLLFIYYSNKLCGQIICTNVLGNGNLSTILSYIGGPITMENFFLKDKYFSKGNNF